MNKESDLYRRLQRHLDSMPIPFPATESGVELSLLKRLFSPREAEIALALSAVPEPVCVADGSGLIGRLFATGSDRVEQLTGIRPRLR